QTDVGIGYGQTEASPYITHTLPADPHPHWDETVGRPLPHISVRIAQPDDGATATLEQVGEICTRSSCVMAGYYNDLTSTDQAIDADGWLHTGDLGMMDEHGYLRIVGRLKDMIIRGGENVYPREIEDLLHNHPAVAEAAVIGVPDGEWVSRSPRWCGCAAGPPATSSPHSAACTSRRSRSRDCGGSSTSSRRPPRARYSNLNYATSFATSETRADTNRLSTHQSPATESGVPGQPGLERAVEMYDCRKRKATTSYSEDDDSPIRGARLSASFGWPIPGLNAASRRDQLWLILSPHQANTAGYRSAAWALPTSGPRLECVEANHHPGGSSS